MSKKLQTSFIAGHSKIYPNWDFWFENKPSGNPVSEGKKFTCATVK
jgi:hypothetical protein